MDRAFLFRVFHPSNKWAGDDATTYGWLEKGTSLHVCSQSCFRSSWSMNSFYYLSSKAYDNCLNPSPFWIFSSILLPEGIWREGTIRKCNGYSQHEIIISSCRCKEESLISKQNLNVQLLLDFFIEKGFCGQHIVETWNTLIYFISLNSKVILK